MSITFQKNVDYVKSTVSVQLLMYYEFFEMDQNLFCFAHSIHKNMEIFQVCLVSRAFQQSLVSRAFQS